jgi:hypothetical protein
MEIFGCLLWLQKKGTIFEGNCLTNEVKVTRAGKPDAAVSKTLEVVQLYDSTRRKSSVRMKRRVMKVC